MLTADTPANGIDLLRTDGDFVVLGNGSILRLLIQPDDSYSINDYDSDGRVEWVSGDSNWWPVRYPRPDGFTGRARIIERDHGSALWWEPYWDLTEAQISAELPRIKELCQASSMPLAPMIMILLKEGRGANLIVGHNIYFETSIIKANVLRLVAEGKLHKEHREKTKHNNLC